MAIKKKKIIYVWRTTLLIFILLGVYLYQNDLNFSSFPLNFLKNNPSEEMNKDISVYFCPEQNCKNIVMNYLSQANSSIKCAFYELDSISVSQILADKSMVINEVQVIIDGDYAKEKGLYPLVNSNVEIYSDGNQRSYMHHKFCIIDGKRVLTGSTNPTENGFNYNDNNIVSIESNLLASSYENEFNQLKQGKYGSNKKNIQEYGSLNLHYKNKTYFVKSLFCPQDSCAEDIVEYIRGAEKEILFATFVLTEDSIEKALLEKSREGIEIKGIIENRMYTIKGSRAEELNQNFIVLKDSNPKTMHHKVIIIDSQIVITGSMNPSNSGANYNDENVLIIENQAFAHHFREKILELFNT